MPDVRKLAPLCSALMESEMESFREIESFERELVDPKIRKDARRIQELLSDEFVEFGSSGKMILKCDLLDSVENPDTAMYQLSDFRFKTLGDAHVLVTYRSVTPPPQQVAHRSSIWVKEKGRWKMLHHQSTVIPSGI